MQLPHPDAAGLQALAAACRAVNPTAEMIADNSLVGALKKSEGDEFTVITGSLYLVGEALELLGLTPATGGERALNEWQTAPPALIQ